MKDKHWFIAGGFLVFTATLFVFVQAVSNTEAKRPVSPEEVKLTCEQELKEKHVNCLRYRARTPEDVAQCESTYKTGLKSCE